MKLTLETGSDWLVLLLLALCPTWNTPYQLNSTLFEILYEERTPLVASAPDLEITNQGYHELLKRLIADHMLQREIQSNLSAFNAPETTEVPHQFQARDIVYICQHWSQSLEPRWKGPYIVLLDHAKGHKDGQNCSLHTHLSCKASYLSIPNWSSFLEQKLECFPHREPSEDQAHLTAQEKWNSFSC